MEETDIAQARAAFEMLSDFFDRAKANTPDGFWEGQIDALLEWDGPFAIIEGFIDIFEQGEWR